LFARQRAFLLFATGYLYWNLRERLSDCFLLSNYRQKPVIEYLRPLIASALGKACFALVLFPVLLVGCGFTGVQDGMPLIRNMQVSAIATPWGVLYFGGSETNARIVAHEACHIERMRKLGAIRYYWDYVTSTEWACQEERRCGWRGPHPACWR